MPIDPSLARQFVDTVTGAGDAVKQPQGVADAPQIYTGVVQSNDYTHMVSVCKLRGGTTNVPVAIRDGRWPSVGSTVTVVQTGQTYLLLGVMGIGYMDPVSVRAYASAAQNTSSTANAIVILDAKTWDPAGAFNTTNYRFTCPVPGRYRVNAVVQIGSLAGGTLQLGIFKNGTTLVSTGVWTTTFVSGVNVGGASIHDVVTCAAGDYLQICQENTTNGMAMITGTANTYATFVLE